MSKEEKGKDSYNIRVLLEGDMAAKFGVVKNFYGLRKNADLLRLLVPLEHERIKAKNSRNSQMAEKPKS